MTIEQNEFRRSILRLEYLDGLRGLSALFVVVYHIFTLLGASPERYHCLQICETRNRWIWTGHQAVDVFIVLSGYCLMLPVARSKTQQLAGGTGAYLKRRARRILPPYYAALGISLLLFLLVPALNAGVGLSAEMYPSLTASAILSHVFLIDNLRSVWWQKIDGPMWSVATEWQIYFFFPFLLLPLWRRLGILPTVVAALALGLLLALAARGRLDQACPWYLGLFALGMAAAVVNFSQPAALRLVNWLQSPRLSWGVIAAGLWLAGLALNFLGQAPQWFCDIIVGAAVSALLVFCTRRAEKSDSPTEGGSVLRVLSSRPAVAAGAFSYSIYLLHIPILLAVQATLLSFSLPNSSRILGLVLAVPVAVGLSYLFHLVFERPFMARPAPKSERAAEIAAVINPAP